MSFAISKKGQPGHIIWTTEMRWCPIHKLKPREHMLECRTMSQAQTIADQQGGTVTPLGKDAA